MPTNIHTISASLWHDAAVEVAADLVAPVVAPEGVESNVSVSPARLPEAELLIQETVEVVDSLSRQGQMAI